MQPAATVQEGCNIPNLAAVAADQSAVVTEEGHLVPAVAADSGGKMTAVNSVREEPAVVTAEEGHIVPAVVAEKSQVSSSVEAVAISGAGQSLGELLQAHKDAVANCKLQLAVCLISSSNK